MGFPSEHQGPHLTVGGVILSLEGRQWEGLQVMACVLGSR